MLICADPRSFQVLVGDDTARKAFPPDQRADLEAILKRDLGDKPDQALNEVVGLVASNYALNAPSNKRAGGDRGDNNDDQGGMGIGGWICIGLCVVMGIWLVVGLMRGMSGGGGAGGGGGFFSSLLGGMFGAAAGMWMYNHFFGGGGHSAYGGDGGMAGGSDSSGYTGTDTDYSGGGGDWGGGDAGGGDFGGGGDW